MEYTGTSDCAAGAGRRVIVFTRYPRPGSTKTRLIPALGEAGAARLQREMTEFTLRTVGEAAVELACAVEVRFEGGDGRAMAEWLGEGLRCAQQGDGTLGDRMARALADTFNGGAGEALVVGTDCPGISADTYREAFAALGKDDLVVGPAHDGGYYLIGMRESARDRALPALFSGPAWGTGTVLETTLSLAAKLGLSVKLLRELRDVDRPEDLAVWEAVHEAYETVRESRPCISVIIPAVNEAPCIGATIRAARNAPGVEVIVADGGSHDATVDVARSCGAKVLSCQPGRAVQANEGAQAAHGDTLLFLHADTVVPPGWEREVERVLATAGTAAGAFAFAVDMPGPSMRLFTRVANFRAKRLRMPYGDQGLFLRKAVFEEVGGFPGLPIMDDFELVRQLRRLGRIEVAAVPAITSGRRWRALGVWRTMLINQVCVAAYLLGVSPQRIARWYNRRRGTCQQ